MKRSIIVLLLLANFQLWAGFTLANTAIFSGSWINSKVYEYYKPGEAHVCDEKFFEGDEFVPLYLSFKGKNQLEITFRYEQTIGIYNVKSSSPGLMIAYKGNRKLKIKLINGTLELEYNGRLLSFKKVSTGYSRDVFGEFIKNRIFTQHANYTLDSFAGSIKFKDKKINRNNFQQALKEIFGADVVEVAQLGTFKHKEFCLPAIAIYYNDSESKWTSPRVLGIIIDKEMVKFIDATGAIILSIKPV